MIQNDKMDALRERIDEIDSQLVPLFVERMSVSGDVARVKRDNNLAILDAPREQQVVDRAVSRAGGTFGGAVAMLMRSILSLSREHQRRELFQETEAPLLPAPRARKTDGLTCAYQGVPGAWSEQALINLYPDASRMQVEYFEDVFLAVKEKRADYGVVPIENSRTGAIGETYDLLRKYGCFIVGRTQVPINQSLLAPADTALADIREVFSHPEGFKQCANYLRNRPWDLTVCRNTAVAAEMAATAKNGKTAAIGSPRAAELNGLSVLTPSIMDFADNKTSFVVIALEPEYDQTSKMLSVTFSTAHRSGALCESLLPFMANGINLVRIESRPALAGNYRFFADLEANILDTNTVAALRQAAAASEYFEVIGCYDNL